MELKCNEEVGGGATKVSSFNPSHYLWLQLLSMVSRLIFVKWLIYVNNKPKLRLKHLCFHSSSAALSKFLIRRSNMSEISETNVSLSVLMKV